MLVHRKPSVNWKMRVQMQQKSGLVQEKYVLQKSRQALELEAGNWPLLDGVRKQLASRSSLTVGSEHMAILQNLSVLERQWL